MNESNLNYIHTYNSPLGRITLCSDGENLTGLWFENQKYYARTLKSKPVQKNLDIFTETKEWLNLYFNGICPSFLPKIQLSDTEFRLKVWKILQNIPYGSTISYGDIAKTIAKEALTKKVSAQAVGEAVGHNPISIIIPCHRVVGATGNLTGYAGGIDKKIKLLEIEGINISQFSVPKINNK